MWNRLPAFVTLVVAAACQDLPTAPLASPPADGAIEAAVVIVDSSAMISGGLNHICALRPNGAAYCWGENAYGQLGDGSTTRNNLPVPVEGGLRFAQISAGGNHTCALTPQGVAYCWGMNLHGRLGDGTTTNRSLPVAVLGGLTFTSISAGGTHTCARTITASIYCWGRNDEGQLGNGTLVDQWRPIKVAGGISWTQVSAGAGLGAAFTCGKTGMSAQVWCWGRNAEGQLGDATLTLSAVPVRVVGGHAWSAVAAGKSHACGLDTAGKAWCWGANGNGQLGTANTTPSLEPVPVYGNATYRAIMAGTDRTCALSPTSRGSCWGVFSTGPQVLGSQVLRALDVGQGGGWCAVRADNGRWYCNDLSGSPVPLPLVASVPVSPPSAGLQPGAVVTFTAVPLDSAGNELDDRAVTWRSSDTTVVRVNATGVATAVNVGTASVIATAGGVSGSAQVTVSNDPVATVTVTPDSLYLNVTDTARLAAELRNGGGQVVNRPVGSWSSTDPSVAQVDGTGLVTGVGAGVARIIAMAEGKSDTSVVVVSLVTLDPASIVTGQRFSCGLTPAGAAWCWGRNGYGELGSPAVSTGCFAGAPEQCSTVPVAVAGGITFQQLTASWLHVCGLTSAGQAYCWGLNDTGQLGTGSRVGCEFSSTACRTVPTAVAGGLTFVDIAAGSGHTCALTAAGETWCWGTNGTPMPPLSPTLRADVPTAEKMEAGGNTTCVLTADGAAHCWAANGGSVQPVPGGRTFAEITVGGSHQCGITRANGLVFCWGSNSSGQFGNGTKTSSATPTATSGGVRFVSISAGAQHTCGVTPAQQAYCWGNGANGRLGTGSSASAASQLVPTQVAAPGVLFATVSAGGTHTCGVTTAGAGRCWGENNLGQLGDGTTSTRNTPTVVVGGHTFDTD